MVIRKYSNRRLYDTDESRYVTLDEVAERIRAGADLRVIEAPGGEDITQQTLAQIILEGRGASRLLPVPLLYQLVRMEDAALGEFFGRYVAWAMEVYVRAKEGARALSPYNPLPRLPFAAGEALARMLAQAAWGARSPQAAWTPEQDGAWGVAEPATEWPAPPDEPAGAGGAGSEAGATRATEGAGAAAPSREEVDALRREMDELKALLRERLGREGP